MMAITSVMEWIERALLAMGIMLAAWSGLTHLERSYLEHLPVPPASAVKMTSLPGEGHATDLGRGTSRTRAVTGGTWLARLEAPSVNLTATVLEGTDDSTLRRSAGHIEGTAYPGSTGNVGIAGHRDTTFRPVRNLKVGDQLLLTTVDRVFEYRIAATKVVNPADVYVLDPGERPLLTLVTCFPFTFIGNARQRYIVHADLVRERARQGAP